MSVVLLPTLRQPVSAGCRSSTASGAMSAYLRFSAIGGDWDTHHHSTDTCVKKLLQNVHESSAFAIRTSLRSCSVLVSPLYMDCLPNSNTSLEVRGGCAQKEALPVDD